MLLKESIISKPIFEEKDSSKLPEAVLCRVSYPVCNIGKRNANKRVYEREVWDKVLGDSTLKEMMDQRRLFGHAEHPSESQSDLQLTSHVIRSMWIDEATNVVFQSIDVLDTPMGRIVDSILRADCLVGVSTRAEGDLEESEDDEGTFSRVIPESYRYITTDFTADPSTFGALPQEVRRGVVSSIATEAKNEKADKSERIFARKLLESMESLEKEKICAKSEPVEYTIASLIAEGRLRDCTDVKRGDLTGSLTIKEGEISIVLDGKPIDLTGVEVASLYPDGTVHVWAKEKDIAEPIEVPPPVAEEEDVIDGEVTSDMSAPGDAAASGEDLEVSVGSKDTKEKVGDKKNKDADESKTNEQDTNVDQLVAKIEELEAKVDAGKSTPEIQAQLDALKDEVSKAGGEIPEGKSEEDNKVKETGSDYGPDEGIGPVLKRRLKKLEAAKKEADEEYERKIANLKDRMKSLGVKIPEGRIPVEGGHSDKLAVGNLLKKDGREDWVISKVASNGVYVHPVGEFEKEQLITWDDLADFGFVKVSESTANESVTSIVKDMADLKIKEAIERAEREVAIEAYQNILEKIKVQEMKVRMLIKKSGTDRAKYAAELVEHNQKHAVGDKEVKAMRIKLEEKAKAAFEAEQALVRIKESIEKEKEELTESISIKVKEQKALVEKQTIELAEAKSLGMEEGRIKGTKEVVKEYIVCKLAELGVSVGENTRALLDECMSLREVDDTLEKITDVMRRSALHSGTVKEIHLETSPSDPEKSKIESDVENAFKGM